MKKQAGFGLIELIVVMVIIVLLVGAFATGGFGLVKGAPAKRADNIGETFIGRTKAAAKDDVCRSNLNQVRMAIQVFRSSSEDTPPETLQETRLGADFYKCPLGGEPYQYDPKTGEVHCVHISHEKY